MPTYCVADAKAGMPRLIDRAIAGEEVIITRHGAPVVEIRPAPHAGVSATREAYEQLRAGRIRSAGAPSLMKLLELIYDKPEVRASTSTPALFSRQWWRKRSAKPSIASWRPRPIS